MKVEELKKYKDSLYSSLSRDLEAFEKNFILITSAILAFSITFIKDIVKINEAVWLPILFIGWFLILIAVGVMMFAFLSSVNGSNELWKLTDNFLIEKKLFDSDTILIAKDALTIKTAVNKKFLKIKTKLKFLRISAIICFLLGFTFFSIFVSTNLYRENKEGKEIRVVSGTLIKGTDSCTIKKDTIAIYENSKSTRVKDTCNIKKDTLAIYGNNR